jgi:chromosome partitioning protein
VRSGTYEVLIRSAAVGPQILHNPRLKLSLLPSSPPWPAPKWKWSRSRREFRLRDALQPCRNATTTS